MGYYKVFVLTNFVAEIKYGSQIVKTAPKGQKK